MCSCRSCLLSETGEGAIGSFIWELSEVLAQHFTDYEMVVVDNGSRDGTAEQLDIVQRELRNVQVFTIAQPIHHDAAFMAGIERAIGDYVVTLDPCFDPVSIVPQLIRTAESDGVDIVYGRRSDASSAAEGWIFGRVRKGFYAVFGRVTGLRFPASVSTVQLFSRRAVNAFLDHADRYTLFKVVGSLTGLPYAELGYDRVSRCSGKSGRASYRSAAATGITSLLFSSNRALRALTVVSLAGAGVNLLYSAYIVVVNIVKDEVAEGWTSLSLQITGLFFILFLVLAVLSEYVRRIFSTLQNQVPYVVTRESSSLHHLKMRELNVIGPREGGPNSERDPSSGSSQ